MKLRDWTILLVPDHPSKVHRIRLTVKRIKVLLIVFGTFLSLFFIFGAGYFSRLIGMRDYERVLAENQDLKVQLKVLAQQINNIQNRLNRVNELDHRIRLAIGMEQSSNSNAGIGGPEPDNNLVMSQLLPRDEANRIKLIASQLARVNTGLDNQEVSLEELDSYLEDNEALITATPSIWPVRGWVTSEFGVRVSPFHGEHTMHEGIDIAAPVGSLIRASANGIVIYTGWDRGYGNLVVIAHGYGLVTKYGHCAEILARRGDSIKRGQVIATVGATGRATGPHLHYEVRIHGVPVNPRRYLFE